MTLNVQSDRNMKALIVQEPYFYIHFKISRCNVCDRRWKADRIAIELHAVT